MSYRVLFFSRGRGRGHAIPDLAISEAITGLADGFEIEFASYATGARTLREKGLNVHDLDLPEANPFLPTLLKCRLLIDQVSPHIIIAHEEFAALPAARIAGKPAIFISAWLPPLNTIMADSLMYADSVVVLEHAGIFSLPPTLPANSYFVGPMLRKVKYTRSDQALARRELNVSADAMVATVIPGAYVTETQAPIAKLVLSAFNLFRSEKELIWIGGSDVELLREMTKGIEHVRILRHWDPIEQVIAASNLVITKATRGATLDASAVGVPTISLSNGLNVVDDILLARITSNIALNSRATDASTLHGYMCKLLKFPEHYRLRPGYASENGPTDVARLVISETQRLVVQ
jgi:hypothetical protein